MDEEAVIHQEEAPIQTTSDETDAAAALAAASVFFADTSSSADINRNHQSQQVKWSCGNWEVHRGLLVFIGTYVLLFIICATALLNLSFTSTLKEVWVSVLSLIIGTFLHQPKPKSKRKLQKSQTFDVQE